MRKPLIVVATALAGCIPFTWAQHHDPAPHTQHQKTEHAKMAPLAKDGRQLVSFPVRLKEETLTNMRDHLLALQEIQAALAKQEFDQAADIAEQRLGMTSLNLHGAHEVAKYMPDGMKAAGSGMHRNASRFAVAAKDAAVSGDLKPALEALSNVTAQCVACHAGYRLK
jgi:hypothetical protein